MLNQETSERLKVLGFDVDKLTEAFKSESEMGLDVPKLFKQDEVNTLTTNIRREGFDEGKQAMGEIFVKDLKKKTGLEFDGKDLDVFIQEFTKKHTSGNDELKRSFEQLQQTHQTTKSQFEQEIQKRDSQIARMQLNGKLSGLVEGNTTIPKDDLLILFQNKYEVKTVDGVNLVFHDGKPMKDELQNPVSVEQAFKSFYQPYLKKDGMSGGDEGGGGDLTFANMDEFMAYCAKKGLEPMAKEQIEFFNKHKKK